MQALSISTNGTTNNKQEDEKKDKMRAIFFSRR